MSCETYVSQGWMPFIGSHIYIFLVCRTVLCLRVVPVRNCASIHQILQTSHVNLEPSHASHHSCAGFFVLADLSVRSPKSKLFISKGVIFIGSKYPKNVEFNCERTIPAPASVRELDVEGYIIQSNRTERYQCSCF